MLTRTMRRLYGSVHVGSITSAVDAERTSGPGDRAEVLGVVQTLEHGEPGAVGDDVVERQRAHGGRRAATTPRCRSKPTTLGDHVAFGDVHRDAAGRQLARACVAKRSTRDGASSTERTSCAGLDAAARWRRTPRR